MVLKITSINKLDYNASKFIVFRGDTASGQILTIFQNSKFDIRRFRWFFSQNRRKLRQIYRIALGTVPWGNISALPTPLLFLFPAWPLLFPPLFHFLCPTNNKRGSRVPNFFPAIGPLQSTGTSCDQEIFQCLKFKFFPVKNSQF